MAEKHEIVRLRTEQQRLVSDLSRYEQRTVEAERRVERQRAQIASLLDRLGVVSVEHALAEIDRLHAVDRALVRKVRRNPGTVAA